MERCKEDLTFGRQLLRNTKLCILGGNGEDFQGSLPVDTGRRFLLVSLKIDFICLFMRERDSVCSINVRMESESKKL